jgi:hypothetical protein
VTLRQSVLLPPALAALALAFVRSLPEGRAFAATFLFLVVAAACGPFTFASAPEAPRWSPLRQGALAALSFALSGALLCAVLDGPMAAGALAGPFAFALGAIAHALGGGLARAFAAGGGRARRYTR